jgi:hypothetical protein
MKARISDKAKVKLADLPKGSLAVGKHDNGQEIIILKVAVYTGIAHGKAEYCEAVINLSDLNDQYTDNIDFNQLVRPLDAGQSVVLSQE